MKKYLFIVSLIVWIGCNKNSEEEFTPSEIYIECLYTTELNGKKFPDVHAKVFIYYNKETSDIFGIGTDSDGTFIKDGKTITPQQKGYINEKGYITFPHLDVNQKILILVISEYYPEKRIVETFLPNKEYNLTCLFNP